MGANSMTWNDLAAAIAGMSAKHREQEVVFVEDIDGPEQQVRPVQLARAEHDVYDGITAGTVIVLERGESFFRSAS